MLLADDIDNHFAFRDFADSVGGEPTVIAHGGTRQDVIRKPRNGGLPGFAGWSQSLRSQSNERVERQCGVR